MLSPWLQAGAYARLAHALLARPRAWAVTASAWSAWCARPRAAGPALTLPYLQPMLRGRASKSPQAHASLAGAAAGAQRRCLLAAPLALCLRQMSPKAAPSHPHTAPGDIRPRTRWSAAASRSPWHGAAHLTSVWDTALESNPGAERRPARVRLSIDDLAQALERCSAALADQALSPAAAGVVQARGMRTRLCCAPHSWNLLKEAVLASSCWRCQGARRAVAPLPRPVGQAAPALRKPRNPARGRWWGDALFRKPRPVAVGARACAGRTRSDSAAPAAAWCRCRHLPARGPPAAAVA